MGLSGGCQCGAVRFHAAEVGRATICHCRMCQKAFGAAFGPLVSVKNQDLTWTRGQPKIFRSSNMVTRGFCANCGAKTAPHHAGWARRCPACATEHYPRTDPVVIMLAEHEAEKVSVICSDRHLFV